MAEPVAQYLHNYSHASLSAMPVDSRWDQVLCIPAYRESPRQLARLFAKPYPLDLLLIVVLNRPDSDPDIQWCEEWQNLCQLAQPVADAAFLFNLPADWPWARKGSHCLLIDRAVTGAPLPAKEGVGLARKIAADTAMALIAQGQIRSPWIHCTDADAQLPQSYFEPSKKAHSGALCFPFEHIAGRCELDAAGSDVDMATQVYEWTLLYWVLQLRETGSNWGWWALGSCLAVHFKDYARVRGFPRRSAAEDFHLLAKLAKISPIKCLANPLIRIQSRSSSRVPFGTGPAVARLQGQPWQEVPVWHPRCFLMLKAANGIAANTPSATDVLSDTERDWLHSYPPLSKLLCTESDTSTRQIDAFMSMKLVRAAASVHPDISLHALHQLRQDLPLPDLHSAVTAAGFAQCNQVLRDRLNKALASG